MALNKDEIYYKIQDIKKNVDPTSKYYGKLLEWKDDGIFENAEPIKLGFVPNEQSTKKHFQCPRGHSFATSSPIVIAVDEDPEFNSGPICSYCYVVWFKSNVNAVEIVDDT